MRSLAGIWGNLYDDLQCFAGDGYEMKPCGCNMERANRVTLKEIEGRDALPISRYGYMQQFRIIMIGAERTAWSTKTGARLSYFS